MTIVAPRSETYAGAPQMWGGRDVVLPDYVPADFFPTSPAEVSPTSRELFIQHREQAVALQLLDQVTGEDLAVVQQDVASNWSKIVGHTEDQPAERRLEALSQYLWCNRGDWIRGTELDVTETFVSAVQQLEAERGQQSVSDPVFAANTDIEALLPVLRYVPKEQQSYFVEGLPEYVTSLLKPAEVEQPASGSFFRRTMDRLARRWRSGGLAAGQTAVAVAVDMSTLAAAEATVELTPSYMTIGGKDFELVSYFDGDPGFEDLTTELTQRRQERYKEDGLLEPSAKEADDIRGPNVEFVCIKDPETGKAIASYRMVHADKVSELPSYRKFAEEDAFDPSGLTELQQVAAGRPVVELAGLWSDPAYGHETVLNLLRDGIQRSVLRNEVWFMGVVKRLHLQLMRTYGPEVVHQIGNPVQVKGEDASEHVRLFPDYLDPQRFYDGLMEGATAAHALRDEKTTQARLQILAHYLIGLDWGKLRPATRWRLKGVLHGNF